MSRDRHGKVRDRTAEDAMTAYGMMADADWRAGRAPNMPTFAEFLANRRRAERAEREAAAEAAEADAEGGKS